MRLPIAAVLLSLAAAVPAAAQNASVAGALELYPTFESVGVRLAWSGDANANGLARIEWRPAGAGAWRAGVPMVRITNQRWAGSVFFLDPGTDLEVRGVIDDPDGGSSATGTVRTRGPLPATPSGATRWVATNGNDANPGTPAAPLATLQAALDASQPGDEVRVRAGVYYQTFATPRSGTASAPIHLVADGPGVVLDGSDPAFLGRDDWRDDGGGIWSVPFTGATRLVVVDSTMRLYRQASLPALQTDANGMTQGWTISGGRLYVKPEGGVNPNGRPVHVARHDMAGYLDVSFVRVVGFEVRHYGTTVAAAGLTLRGASRCELIGNSIHAIGGKGIYLRAGASDNLVEHNVCRDPRISGWPWNATKGHEEELQGISDRGGRGNVIRYNTVRGTFDGIDAGGDTSEDVASDTDIHDNRIVSVGDDALETELFDGINMRVYRNLAEDMLNGISVAPNYVGPTYVLYNTFHNGRRGGFKFSLGSNGETFLYHNTVASARSGFGPLYPSGTYSYKHFRNNIMVGRGQPALGDDAGESEVGNDFDGDLLHAISYGSLVVWKGVAYSTLAAFRSATGFEANGRSGDPLFTNAAAGDYSLRAGSPAIDAAVRLPGINDAYLGGGPDIGALESGSTAPDTTPPAAITDLSSR